MRLFLVTLLFLAMPAWAQNLTGTWEGSSYEVKLSERGIDGKWASTNYDLDISTTFRTVSGSIGNGRVDINFSKTFSTISGKLPCGNVDIDYSSTFRTVEGTICATRVDLDLERGSPVEAVAVNLVLTRLTSHFPQPTQSVIEQHIANKLSLQSSGPIQYLDLEGSWEGKRYDINLNKTFTTVEGNWGTARYDVDVSRTFKTIEGSVPGGRLKLGFSTTFSEITGNLPCGPVKVDYSSTSKLVEGKICGNQFKINVASGQGKSTAENLVLDQVMSYFPAPVRVTVKIFILQNL